MKEIKLITEVTFLEIAEGSFNFPITDSIRLSFWILGDRISTFSEIIIDNKIVNVGKIEILEIIIVEREFLINGIKIGAEFELGTFPYAIALGKIIGFETYREGGSVSNDHF